MLIYLAVAAGLIAAPVLGLWPRVQITGRPFNGLYFITMHAPDDPVWRGRSWRGIVAQEVIEHWIALTAAVLLAAPLAWLARDVPGHGAVALPAIVVIWRIVRGAAWSNRQIELIGHMAEIVWAQGRERYGPDYLPAKAQDIYVAADLYGAAFKGWSALDIAEGLERRRALAGFLIAVMRRAIERVK
jgi:hypothetical protein